MDVGDLVQDGKSGNREVQEWSRERDFGVDNFGASKLSTSTWMFRTYIDYVISKRTNYVDYIQFNVP